MLALTLWLLTSPAGPLEPGATEPRWALELELPRKVEVLGLGTLPIEVRARYLLRGPLAKAQAERCSLEVRSPLATASALPTPPIDGGLRLVERSGEILSEDTSALLPPGRVRFSLQIVGLGIQEMSGETRGRLHLQGRRVGDRIGGEALLVEPQDHVSLPAGLQVSLAPEAAVRGRFLLTPSAAERCDQLALAKGGVAWVP